MRNSFLHDPRQEIATRVNRSFTASRTDSNAVDVICGASVREGSREEHTQPRVMIGECVFHASQFEFTVGVLNARDGERGQTVEKRMWQSVVAVS